MAKRLLHQNRVPVTHQQSPLGVRKLKIRLIIDDDTSNTSVASPSENVATDVIIADAPIPVPQPIKPRYKLGSWSLLWLIVLMSVGGTGVVGLLLLTTLPPLPDCQHVSPLVTDGDRLYCAQQSAHSGKIDQLVAAIQIVQDWPLNHPLHLEAQRMLGEWSQDLLTAAQKKINSGNLSYAVTIAGKIPKNSPLYSQAQKAIATWQQEWQQGEVLSHKFQDALKVQNWQLAWQQLEAMTRLNFTYWRSSTQDKLIQQLAVEKQGWQELQDARDLAQSNNPDDLASAIAKAEKVDPTTYIKPQAQAERNKWSHTLLNIAIDQFHSQDFPSVMAIVKGIPADVEAYGEAQDLIRINRASTVAKANHILAFLDALAAVRPIEPSSPLYQEALSRESLWKNQMQDQLQLLFARAVAGVEQPTALSMAIAQAQLVVPSHRDRTQAQTLIASWRKEMQLIADRSTMTRARILAKPRTIENLKEAIAQASQIALGQPLRIEAQTAIASWNQQIQIIEDQPIMDLARAYAQKGELDNAVSTAQKINPERALGKQAQAAIDEWVRQIQIAQDRPIMDGANALAAQGRLSSAILTASQVNVGRPLYPEAQAAIERWQSQLNPTVPPTDTNSDSPANH